jgi:hypothetical protein
MFKYIEELFHLIIYDIIKIISFYLIHIILKVSLLSLQVFVQMLLKLS